MTDDSAGGTPALQLQYFAAPYVVRSAVPRGRPYEEYLENLRFDFFYSCGYCTMTESEGMAIRFAIDDYEARRARPDLVDDYTNLMYACDGCNARKGDRSPPADARATGYRFFSFGPTRTYSKIILNC
jgi:hypothetical protein